MCQFLLALPWARMERRGWQRKRWNHQQGNEAGQAHNCWLVVGKHPDMRGKKTEGWGKKTNLPEEGASTSMWDLRKACVYLKWWPGSTAYSHGHSCLGIKRNMRKRQRGAGAVKRLEKGPVTPTAESVLIAGGGDHRGNPLEHHWVKLIVDIYIYIFKFT